MSEFGTALLLLAALVLAIPLLTLLAQVLASLPRAAIEAEEMQGARPSVAVLVPAHNEEEGIGETVASILAQLRPGDRVVVIADNCSDKTADAAKGRGAEVAIRTSTDLRGKGYALDHGLRFLQQSGAPDIVVIVDADCRLEEGCIDRLVRRAGRTMRPVQGVYLMNPPRSREGTVGLISFAWKVRRFVRPLGWHRLGLPSQLGGSGMAFPWAVLQSANLASGELAEDVKLGLDLALTGAFPVFCPDARLMSDVVAGPVQDKGQRARWEHGMIDLLVRYLPRLIGKFFRTGDRRLLFVALDIGIPPLALLALGLGGHFLLSAIFVLLTGSALPIAVSLAGVFIFGVAIGLSWWRHGQDNVSLNWLLWAPIYAMSKIPLYVKFLTNRQREWKRADRR